MTEHQSIQESEGRRDPDQDDEPQMGMLGSKARTEATPADLPYRCPIYKGSANQHWLGCPDAPQNRR